MASMSRRLISDGRSTRIIGNGLFRLLGGLGVNNFLENSRWTQLGLIIFRHGSFRYFSTRQLEKSRDRIPRFAISTTKSFKRNLSTRQGKKDFYEVLGVSPTADKATIKKAYFQLAKKYHPDTNKDNEKEASEKFKEVTEAYEVLSDEKQRELYDQFGHAGVDPNFNAGQGANPFGAGFEGFNFGDGSFHFSSSSTGGAAELNPEELFDMFFGGGRNRGRSRGPRRGADLQMHVRVPFRDAVFGTSKNLNVRYQVLDKKSGEYRTKEREVTVQIPAGIDNGMNLRLQGQGAEGDPGAASGNLLVQVIVDSDDYFVRDGYDVHTEVPINLVQAVLGGSVDVKTLNGEVEMKIPKGCQPQTKMVLRGLGIQKLNNSGKGDQIVHLKVVIPQDVTPRQEELLREFESENENHSGFSAKIGKAAESAFERMFGRTKKSKKDESKKKSDGGNENQDAHNHSKAEDTDDEPEKKHAAH